MTHSEKDGLRTCHVVLEKVSRLVVTLICKRCSTLSEMVLPLRLAICSRTCDECISHAYQLYTVNKE